MQYRRITREKLNVSLLGYGCMRFPVIDGDNSRIDYEESERMLRLAIDNGVNYIDTAYPYHGGKSEEFVGHALSHGLRDKVLLATKSPVWLVETYDDFIKYLDQQLVNLQTKTVDFYLLHSLHRKVWDRIISLGVFDFIKEAKDSGKIKYIGFSFHDELPVFKEIIDSYPWDFCQIQLNYMDQNYQAGLEGLEYARMKGIDVIIMEPLKGGKLANPSDDIKNLMSNSTINRTPAEFALKWVQQLEGVTVVLSGMSDEKQVEENTRTSSDPQLLTSSELHIIHEAENLLRSRIKVGCTGCEYCLPCPSGVKIPRVFDLYNSMSVYETVDQSRNTYKDFVENGSSSLSCVECGQCELICPQQIQIIRQLKEAHEALI
jgi:hypothetical protein